MTEVAPRLLEVFAPVARDLASAGFAATLRWEDRFRSHELWTALLYVDGQRLGRVGIDPAASMEGQVEQLAIQVQDHVLEFVRRGRKAVVWPRCRGSHPHPMVISRSSAGCSPSWPTWVCPIDGDYRALVGGPDGASHTAGTPRSDAAPAIAHDGTALSAEPMEIDPTATGTVRWYLADKGFGVITRDGSGEDVFVVFSAIKVEGFKTLAEGQSVDFELVRSPDGTVHAEKVRPRP